MNWHADKELRSLVDGILEGDLGRAQVARLEERIEGDPRAMDYYLGLAGQEALLADLLGKVEPEGLVIRPWWRRPVLLWAASAAAVVAVTFSIMEEAEKSEDRTAKSAWARLSSGVAMTDSKQRLSDGSLLGHDVGLLEFGPGLAEVVHDSGARLLIEGPAGYEVTGPNSGKLSYGTLVAEIPRGAEGYVVEWADGRVVDLGTEFVINVPKNRGPAEVGVFRGEVRVHPDSLSDGAGAPLYTGHAVRMAEESTTGLRSIPFDQDRFIRKMPSRELPWFFEAGSQPMEWDISHLVWSGGELLAVFKWMNGPDALVLDRVELLLDGEVAAVDAHTCSVGDPASTLGNVYRLAIPADGWRKGNWQLRAWPAAGGGDARSEGILMVENGSALAAEAEDFMGAWDYVHDGKSYRRMFHRDGTCTLWVDDQPSDYFLDAHWEVVGGILKVNFPASRVSEEHLLRDRESLLFINQPYRNARRAE